MAQSKRVGPHFCGQSSFVWQAARTLFSYALSPTRHVHCVCISPAATMAFGLPSDIDIIKQPISNLICCAASTSRQPHSSNHVWQELIDNQLSVAKIPIHKSARPYVFKVVDFLDSVKYVCYHRQTGIRIKHCLQAIFMLLH